ncbi:MAG: hypothetical protein ACEQSN_17250, partial [Yersinia sp. (in: enterobacteria)]
LRFLRYKLLIDGLRLYARPHKGRWPCSDHMWRNQPGPVLIHALIDVDEKVYPMVPPGAANIDMIGGE